MPGQVRYSLALLALVVTFVAADAFDKDHRTSTQSSFVVYVFFEFTGQPSNSYFTALGLQPLYLTADVMNGGTVTQGLMRSTADAAASYGAYQSRACWDIEGQYQTDATYPAGSPLGLAGAHRIADSLAQFLGWARSEQPSLQIGLYSGVPVTNIWLDDTTEWKQNNDTLSPLTNAVDYIAPSLYLYYPESTLPFSYYAPGHIAEARRIAPTKKIFPFVSPAYHPSGPLANTYTDYAGMMNVLNVIKASGADGCIIFAGNGSMGSQYGDWATASTSDWWQAIKDFLGATSSPPAVTGLPATSITATSGQVNGTVNPNGAATMYHFDYGTSASYGSSTSATSAGSGSSAVTVTASLAGLTSNTTYHYRLVAISSGGTTNGTDATFATLNVPPPHNAPLVADSGASSITTISAQLNATVNPNGIVTSYHFDYGTSGNYGISTTSLSTGSGSTPTSVSAPIAGLLPGTLYHFRVIATNSAGTSPGGDVTFMTLTVQPVVSVPAVATAPASQVTSTGALLSGTLDPNGFSTIYHFDFGTTQSYGSSTSTLDAGAGTNPVSVTAPVTVSKAGTLYHFRLVATNTGGTVYGGDFTFMSLSGSDVAGVPDAHELWQNYPNPFNPSTQIEYELHSAGMATLKVFNTLGVEVATLASGVQQPGRYLVQWDGKGCTSGAYFYVLTSGGEVTAKRMILVR